ncbi:mannitol dehydrogenase family protein [Rhodopirellula europaea]|uniref:Mannitol dehydrogenase domain-containing protein n=1 Tax=Rhodopirellula europaea SH398 TaxID=1263868 RepID=M5RY50_9BACT|nr:mannitol dehydrogenase family protein [Rhodopirellula europaea]EMI24278.1 mannitol dehydrogenase domain-containing protein [Rhodopirellula europaea SH398]
MTNETKTLNEANLTALPAELLPPQYDRSRLKPRIVHVGVGGFHRSHEAFYTDELLRADESCDWGICGVGLRPGDEKIASILKEQDYLYTLIIRHPDGTIKNRVIGSIIDFLMGCDDPESVIEQMASPDTRIVSLTITEGGYNLDAATGDFNWDHPDAQHDLEHPTKPKMVFGFLTEALKHRRARDLPAFTIQSCDNIQHNGDLTRKTVLGFAKKQDRELAEWIEAHVCFPNAMVDRITPVTTDADIAYLAEEHQLTDQWPVTCEPFCQWVVEDSFSSGRPKWESVGAQFVPDVVPYEKMKLRLLNAGHSVLGILGSIHGHRTIDGCVSDPLFASYLRQFMDVEVTPVLDQVDGIDLEAYKDTLLERFGNPNIKDALSRICLESSSKLPVFLIPTIQDNLARGGSIQFATLVIAAWCFYSDKQTDEDGNPLEITDALKTQLHDAAEATRKDPLSFLEVTEVFGDLIENETFTKQYVSMVETLYETTDVASMMQRLLRN